MPSTSARVLVLALVGGLLVVLAPQAGCTDALGLCKPTSSAAGASIITAWCQRYIQCDAKRGTLDDCVSTRTSVGQVPSSDGCAATCSEDVDCHRSSCDQAKIDQCKADSQAMKCEDQVSNMIVRFPSFCDSCFSN